VTLRTKIIIAKCMTFPFCFIITPIIFIAYGIKGIVETWKTFVELDEEELRSEVEK
jgi:hypothetical protein